MSDIISHTAYLRFAASRYPGLQHVMVQMHHLIQVDQPPAMALLGVDTVHHARAGCGRVVRELVLQATTPSYHQTYTCLPMWVELVKRRRCGLLISIGSYHNVSPIQSRPNMPILSFRCIISDCITIGLPICGLTSCLHFSCGLFDDFV